MQRWAGWYAVALLAAFAAVAVSSVLQESQIWDEAIYISSGYSYLKTGDYRLNREHPPLAKLLDALPLLALDPKLPLSDRSWTAADEVAFGRLFLYGNRVSADAMLLAARSVTIVLAIALGALVFAWTNARAGPVAAAIALTLYAFDPNVIAHGRYATNDLPVALFCFAAAIAFERALKSGRLRSYALAGAALGAALATKLSALFLLPALAALIVVIPGKKRAAVAGVPIAIAIAWAFMLLVARGDAALYAGGVRATFAHAGGGQLSYLFGMESTHGWWWYFPAAFALKSPVGLLALAAVAAFLLARHLREAGDLAVLAIPIAVYGALCLFDRADIGIRYLLPIYPFLFALVGIVCARYANKALVVACLAAVVVESVAVYPNYLPFFNALAGGPGAGPRYLLDSNVDWGQDAKRLAAWLGARGTETACVSYFGTVPLDYYGIDVISDAPHYDAYVRHTAPRCYVAVSANYLYGEAILGSSANRWLRGRVPVDKIGYSIYVYDLRNYR
jgi:4-amino-4-deoxy-L-arabinose transferase-like glycosyltransferase